ncbi:MAG: LmeA family phospholipid-binding protein, partial [Actinomycetota bacterium]
MFIIRRLIYFIAIPVALFLGGSAIVESFAEGQLANGMRTTLNLKEKPAVQIEAFPIFLRIVQGRIPRVTVDAHTIVIEGLEIAEISMVMEGVEASLGVLIRQNKFDLTVEHGNGFA